MPITQVQCSKTLDKLLSRFKVNHGEELPHVVFAGLEAHTVLEQMEPPVEGMRLRLFPNMPGDRIGVARGLCSEAGQVESE